MTKNETHFAKIDGKWYPFYKLQEEKNKTREEIKKLYVWIDIDFT